MLCVGVWRFGKEYITKVVYKVKIKILPSTSNEGHDMTFSLSYFLSYPTVPWLSHADAPRFEQIHLSVSKHTHYQSGF